MNLDGPTHRGVAGVHQEEAALAPQLDV
jgi:hypothetical protein